MNNQENIEIIEETEDVFQWSELSYQAKKSALHYFCKYGCYYISDSGELIEALDYDDENTAIVKRIIKAIKSSGIQFYSDGQHF